MEAYVAPQVESQMMRVDRNDIWYNIMQIQSAVRNARYGLTYPVQLPRDYLHTYAYSDPSPEAEALRALDAAESSRRQRNYEKLDAFCRSASTGAGYQPCEDALDAIWGIYNERIKTFENTDDDYSYKASFYYDMWSTLWDRTVDRAKVIYDFSRGVDDALAGMVDGLLTLGAFLLYTNFNWGSDEECILPDCITDRAKGMEEGLSLMLHDPVGAFEAMGQSMMDTYDEEGISYAIGNAAPDIVIEILAAKGAGLAMRGTARTADVTGDMAQTVQTVNRINHATDAIHAADTLSDAASGARLLDVVEDTASGAKLLDVVEDTVSGAKLLDVVEDTVNGAKVVDRTTDTI